MMRREWTHEELRELRREIENSLHETEREYPDIRPLPAMEEAEAKELLKSFITVAEERRLTQSEGFMMGQLLSAFTMAVEARMLGKKKGRYMVISEEQLRSMQKEKGDLG